MKCRSNDMAAETIADVLALMVWALKEGEISALMWISSRCASTSGLPSFVLEQVKD